MRGLLRLSRLPSRRLGWRIALLILALVLVVQLAGFALIRSVIASNARLSIAEQLTLGERVFTHLFEQNAAQLLNGAKVLAADYGFREAIASRDGETIASALSNHGARIGATITVFQPADGSAPVSGEAGDDVSGRPGESMLSSADLSRLIARVGQGGARVDNQAFGRHLYQLVTLPVRAPNLLGHVVIGFSVDGAIARQVWELSGLHLSFLARQADSRWAVLDSTLDVSKAMRLAQSIDAADGHAITLGDDDYRYRALPVAVLDDPPVAAVLQRSLREAMARFDRLQVLLLSLTIAGLLVSALGSAMTARRITRPITALVEGAKRLGAGDYDARVPVDGRDEIAALGQAFNQMRDQIGEREARIRRLAFQDALTELPNRLQFAADLEAVLEVRRRDGGQCHMLMIDLARFKHVNDVLGHAFGDALLQEVARRFTAGADPRGRSLARLAGDEFALIVDDAPQSVASEVATATTALLSAPFRLHHQTIDLSAGVGIASFPAHAEQTAGLIAKAEVAMYAAKRARLPLMVFDPRLDQSSQDNLSLSGELREAMRENQLTLYFQPKLSLADGRVSGVETLVRWLHPARGMVSPDRFIPFAEQTGLITEMTHWILARAAAQVRAWRQQGVSLTVAVNLSTRDLLDPDFAARVLRTMTDERCSPRDFCLEITESAIMDDADRALATLDKLHAMGFRLSIDDFGTGYSSLAYLKRLPVDEIKIDRSFVMNMQEDGDDQIIVRSTVHLGHSLGLKVVAEGVENEAIWHGLTAIGCDEGQGYFMSRPLPADQLLRWLPTWAAPAPPTSPAARSEPAVRSEPPQGPHVRAATTDA